MAGHEQGIWTVMDCLDWTTGFLGRKGEEHPRVSAEWLLCAATGLTRIDLYTHFDRPLSMHERDVMRAGVRRRSQGEPLQYITGETAFRSLSIQCAPGVLIPRPETEFLVDLVLSDLDERVLGPCGHTRERAELPWNAAVEAARLAEEAARDAGGAEEGIAAAPDEDAADVQGDAAKLADGIRDADASVIADAACARVLEVGCGTGCISLSLASERPGNVRCVATDIEHAPVELALRNRERCGVDPAAVDIREGDLAAPVIPEEYGTFDVLVSNPPYIPSAVMDTLPREVNAFEPHVALDGGSDGLDVYRRLVEVAPRVLKPGGLFACELFEGAVDDAAALCRAAGFERVRVIEDLARRPRYVFAYMPGPEISE